MPGETDVIVPGTDGDCGADSEQACGEPAPAGRRFVGPQHEDQQQHVEEDDQRDYQKLVREVDEDGVENRYRGRQPCFAFIDHAPAKEVHCHRHEGSVGRLDNTRREGGACCGGD